MVPTAAPGPDDARERLGRELLRPEYHEEDLLQRLVDAIERFFAQAVEHAAGLPMVSVAAALAVGLVLVLVAAVLLSRLRRAGSRSGDRSGPVHGEHRASADEHRAAALEAYDRGDHGTCVAEAFRATVLRPVEAGTLLERPGATAAELARELGRLDLSPEGERRGRVDALARVFDAVVYGHRTAGREQALEALAVDDLVAGVRR